MFSKKFMSRVGRCRRPSWLVLVAVLLACCLASRAQNSEPDSGNPDMAPAQASAQEDGQAPDQGGAQTRLPALNLGQEPTPPMQNRRNERPRAAGTAITLPASEIVALLQKEPGLNLAVKHMLVRKVAQQGRILYQDELTDEILFNLIRQDTLIRGLVTQEIESRGYFSVRPTPAEASDQERARQAAELQKQRQQNAISREDSYLRALDQAQLGGTTPANGLSPGFREGEVSTAAPVRPEELPQLLAGGSAPGAGLGAAGLTGTSPASLTTGASAAAGLMANPGIGASNLGLPNAEMTSNLDQSAMMTTRRLPVRRPNLPPKEQNVSDVRHQPNPYADVPSLYDLYAKAARRQGPLERFGSDVFRNENGNLDELPIDLPVGPDYVLGPGDGLKIEMWGSVSERLQRIVDREGRIALPEVGTVLVAGRSLGDVQREVQAVLRTQFRDVQADISLGRLRTVRVYVVGFVQYPGAYDISALSTPLNAMYAAGGPTSNGSMRVVRHMRGKELVQQVDLYDLLLHGVQGEIRPLQPGDSIVVPAVGPAVTIEGMVRRPAIFELNGETSLSAVLELAGGVLPTGTLRHIQVQRLQSHEKETSLQLDIPETNDAAAVNTALEEFKVRDGDVVRISRIAPYNDGTVYLDGHVFRPGKYAYKPGMRVSDLIHSYTELLPEPSLTHAEIIRLDPPDFRPEVISFNLAEALSAKGNNPELKPYDVVRTFSRFDFEDPPMVTVGGEVRQPGEHRTNGETHLRDAIYLAGGLTPDASLHDAQVFRFTPTGGMQVFDVDLAKAMSGDASANILLAPLDRLIVQRSLAKVDPPTVAIQGEIASPGKYPLAKGMRISDLVRMAGGLKRSAYTDSADLSRYVVQNGKRILGEHEEVAIGKAVIGGDRQADLLLRDADVVTIRRLAGWSDIGASVTVEGEVAHPSTYGIQDGERLSSVLLRAGGFRAAAYPYGAVLERVQVKELAEKSRQEMIRRLEAGQGIQAVKVGFTASSGEAAAALQAVQMQQQQVLASLKSQPPSGRLVIHISSDISGWANTPADIEVRAGDTITIPKKPDFVIVSGQVYNANAMTYVPGKNANWYLHQAGGLTGMSDKSSIYIIRADGSVVGHEGTGWWKGDVLSTKMQPGDMLVVPQKVISGTPFWKDLMSMAGIAANLAIAAHVLTS